MGLNPIPSTICIACVIMICSYALVRAWDEVTGDSAQHVLEDCKIKTVITTIQSDGNLIKQDTTYHYTYHFYNEEGISSLCSCQR